MQSNVELIDSPSEAPSRLRVLDESLVNYGFNRGDEVSLSTDSNMRQRIPVWSLEGGLHARFLEPVGLGWVTAYTSFGYAGKICFSLNPDRVRMIRAIGFMNTEISTDKSNDLLGRK